VTLGWPYWLGLAAIFLLLLAWVVAPALFLTRPARARRVQAWPGRTVLALWATSLLSWAALLAAIVVDWQITLDIDGLLELLPWLLALLLACTLLITLPLTAITVTWLRRGHRPQRLADSGHGHNIPSDGESG